MINKTCLKAGHRWSQPIGAGGGPKKWWIEIRRCLRVGCDRLRYEDDRGQIFTYRHSTATGTIERKVIAKSN